MKFDILTIFPNILDSYISESILKRAQEKDLVNFKFWNIRGYTEDKHHSVDDTPYGGGPGMVFKVGPVYRCLKDILGQGSMERRIQHKVKNKNEKIKNTIKKSKIIMLSPRGEQFSQAKAEELAGLDQLVLVAGRYEGIDARVEKLVDEQLSIGPYVLSGGELPAMVVVEAITRLLPGVLGSADSLRVESFSTSTSTSDNKKKDALDRHIIEYPQYTRPEVFEPIPGVEWTVPEVLMSGDHKKIEEWRKKSMGRHCERP